MINSVSTSIITDQNTKGEGTNGVITQVKVNLEKGFCSVVKKEGDFTTYSKIGIEHEDFSSYVKEQ